MLPAALAVITTDDEYRLAYIVVDGHCINSVANGLLDALIVLLAVYYTQDIHYPWWRH